MRFVSPILNRIRYKYHYWDITHHKLPVVFVYQVGRVGSKSIERLLLDIGIRNTIHTHTITKAPRPVRQLFYDLRRTDYPVKIVTLVRGPVERNLSYYGYITSSYSLEGFLETVDHEEVLRWFDDEFKEVTGIDIYQYELPDTGYLRIKHNNLDCLIMKHDLPNATKLELLANLLELFRTINEGSDEYKKFVDGVRLPRAYIYQMNNSKYGRWLRNELK